MNSSIFVGSGDDSITIDGDDSTYRLWIGNETIDRWRHLAVRKTGHYP